MTASLSIRPVLDVFVPVPLEDEVELPEGKGKQRSCLQHPDALGIRSENEKIEN